MTKKEWETFLGLTAAGGLIVFPLGAVPGLVYGGYKAGKPLVKWLGKGAKSAAKLHQEASQRRRERIEAEQAEAARQEAERNKPKPKTKQELYREIMTRQAEELALVDSLDIDDDENEVIRARIKGKYEAVIERLFE